MRIQNPLRPLLPFVMAALLAACSQAGSDSSNSNGGSTSGGGTSPSSTTTLGTRASESADNPALTDSPSVQWSTYSRAEDYPNVLRLPLQFITLSTGANAGKKLGVLVSVPANRLGRAASGKFPAILTQTAYRIDLGEALSKLFATGNTLVVGGTDEGMIKRGYVSVAVDVLGSGVSDGEEKLLDTNEQDGYGDVVDWITQQDWSDGTIGVAGTSYLGITSLLTAERQQAAVKAAFVEVPMGDAWRDVIGTGGMLNGLFVATWLQLTQNLSVQNDAAIAANPDYATQIEAATQEHVAAINDFFLPLLNDSVSGAIGYGSDDGDFWNQRSPVERAGSIRVPTFILGANHDIFQRGEPLLYEQLKRKVSVKLAILPGVHLQAVGESLLGADGNNAGGPPATPGLLLQWFDHYLKGIDSGAERQPRITQYVIGLGGNGAPSYAIASDWPHPQLKPRRLYLHGDMSLSDVAPTGSETTHTVSEPAAPTFDIGTSSDGTKLQLKYTPSDDSDCSISYYQWTLGIAAPKPCFSDNATVERKQKALNYELAIDSADLYINGPLQADVWMSSTATAAAISVRVDDVSPDGTVTPLSNGLMSAAHRAVDTRRSRYIQGVMMQPWHPYTVAALQPVVAGQAMLVPVEIFPTAALIRKGHRLRVSISASNQSQGMWTTADQRAASGGVSTILNDAQHPSSIVLPVVPASVLPGS